MDKIKFYSEINLVDNRSKDMVLCHILNDVISWDLLTLYLYEKYNVDVPKFPSNEIKKILAVTDELEFYIYSFDGDIVKIGTFESDLIKCTDMVTEFQKEILSHIEKYYGNYYKMKIMDSDKLKMLLEFAKYMKINYQNVYKFLGINYQSYHNEIKKIK